jgi:ABC-2 type transport system permease protein
MNIYLHELKVYRKNTLLWIVSLCAGLLFIFWMFPTFAQNADVMKDMLNNLPLALRIAFGFSIDAITTVTGFYSFVVTFFVLCGAVQAMMLGISVLSRETTGKTADFLLTRPVARATVLTAKLLAAVTCVTVTSALYVAFSVFAATTVADTPIRMPIFLQMAFSFYYLQLLFVALGFCMGAIVPRIRSVLPIAMSTAFGFYLIGVVAGALDLQELYYLSPFKYFNTVELLLTSTYRTSYILMAVTVTVLAVVTAYGVYLRRDIHSA